MLQLFDSRASCADAVAAFVRDGLARGEVSVVVMSRPTWERTASRLSVYGIDVDDAIHRGRLTVLDAHDTLKKLSRGGVPDRNRFDATVGTLMRRLRAGGTSVRAYGEMVDLLAAEGDYRGATLLEELWNELRTRESFTLFCGYSAVHFGDPATAEALRDICRLHSRVRANPLDPLGAHLLQASS